MVQQRWLGTGVQFPEFFVIFGFFLLLRLSLHFLFFLDLPHRHSLDRGIPDRVNPCAANTGSRKSLGVYKGNGTGTGTGTGTLGAGEGATGKWEKESVVEKR